MFIFKNWKTFCKELQQHNIKTLTAAQAFKISGIHTDYIIIKHDVETNVKKALKIARIEYQHGIKATYYVQAYLLSNAKNLKALLEIESLGHEVTYHYDVLDSNNGNWQKADEEFTKNLKLFNSIFNNPVLTICPHGNPLLKREGWDSNKDFFRNKKVRKKYSNLVDIVINPEIFINDKLLYISDAGFGWKQVSNIKENDRKISKDHPISDLNELLKIITNNPSGIILSSHPHRWNSNRIQAWLQNKTFFFLRYVSKILFKSKFFKRIISKFYHLAKKI